MPTIPETEAHLTEVLMQRAKCDAILLALSKEIRILRQTLHRSKRRAASAEKDPLAYTLRQMQNPEN